MWRLFTSGWIHQDFEHLVSNMMVLLVCGRLLEPAIGSRLFAKGFVLTTCIASIAGLSDSGSAGASGGVFGVIAALLVVPAHVRPRTALVIRVLAALFVVTGFIPDPEVAVTAHIGGILAGIVAGLAWKDATRVKEEPENFGTVFTGYSDALRLAYRVPNSRLGTSRRG